MNNVKPPPFLNISQEYLINPNTDLDKAEQALLSIASWLSDTNKYVPVITRSELTFRIGKKNNGNKILDFASNYFFAAQLELIKPEPRVRVEWYFANLSRSKKRCNPLSEWLTEGKKEFIPYDIATTCADIKKRAFEKMDRICEKAIIMKIGESDLAYMRKNLNLVPAHLFFKDTCRQVKLKDLSVDSIVISKPKRHKYYPLKQKKY